MLSEPTKIDLPFCTEYSESSCCTAEETLLIKASLDGFLGPECKTCYQILTSWKCANCNPNAAQWIQYDKVYGTYPLVLCDDFCFKIYEACIDIPFNITSKRPFYFNQMSHWTKERFCEGFLGPEPNCFRGYVPDDIATDISCKCPTHDCKSYPNVAISKEEL